MYKLNPDSFPADDFIGKKVAVYSKHGTTVGIFDGYDYDYNDDDEQTIEIAVIPEGADGSYAICFVSDENVTIEALD